MCIETRDRAVAASTAAYAAQVTRKLRPQEAGFIYHVNTRGNRRCDIYQDDFDRRVFLDLLGNAVAQFHWICHAYCLMTTHYHLQLTTREPNIAAGMQMLNSRYAEYFNRRYKLTGHLFQGRYGSKVAEDEVQFLEAFRYVVLNPVRAGLCVEPEAWPWSSYRFTLGLEAKPDFLEVDFVLDCFASDRGLARHGLRSWVRERQTQLLAA
jgi:REP element-mobilizing transposase RayT